MDRASARQTVAPIAEGREIVFHYDSSVEHSSRWERFDLIVHIYRGSRDYIVTACLGSYAWRDVPRDDFDRSALYALTNS